MYAALTFFGQGTLICKSSSPLDNGKTVSVTDGKKTWSGTMTDGVCVFKTLPAKQKYTVCLINGDDVEYATEVIFGFGDCQEIDVGLDKTTWKGLKAIVNAGLENEMLAVGDQISEYIGGEEQVFDIVHIDYRAGVYGRNVILAKHTCLSDVMPMNTAVTNYGGYKATHVANYLDNSYYNSLPTDMKSVITKMTFKAGIGNAQITLQNEEHFIWLPLQYSVLANADYIPQGEVSENGAEQFSYFVSVSNRIKYIGSSAVHWWCASPITANTNDFAVVSSTGIRGNQSAGSEWGVCPFFMIAADN